MRLHDPIRVLRLVDLIAAALMVVAACPAAAQTSIKFSLDGRLEGVAATFFLPHDKGYFKADGLDVHKVPAEWGVPKDFGGKLQGQALILTLGVGFAISGLQERGSLFVAPRGISRHRHDWHAGELVVFADQADEIETADVRQLDIGDHQVGREIPGGVERIAAVGHRLGLVPMRGKETMERLAYFWAFSMACGTSLALP